MPTTPKPTTSRLLGEGLAGDDVKYLQEALNELGFDVGPAGADGIFGPDTKAAVIAFQTAKGIGVDGLVGPETWGTLDTALQSAAGSGGGGAGGAGGSGAVPVIVGPGGQTPGAGDPPDIGTPPPVTDPDGDGTTVAVPVVVDPTPAAFEYQIVWGDTLGSIAGRFDTTVQAIVDANNSITDPNVIHEGQFIVVPPNPYTAPTSSPSYHPDARLDDEDVVWVAIDFDTFAEAQAIRDAIAAGGYVGLVPEEADLLGITMRQTERVTDDISIELSEIEALTGLSSGLGLPIADIGQVMRRAGLFVQQSAALAGGYQINNVTYAGSTPSGSTGTAGPTGSLAAAPGGAVNQPQLQQGSRGPSVGLLQQALALLGLSPGRADEIFGPITDDRVREFQTRQGLVSDGIVGVMTWGAVRQGLVNEGSAGAQALIRQIDAGSGSLAGTSTSSGGTSPGGGAYPPRNLNLGAMDPKGLLSSPNVNPELAQRVAAVLRDLTAAGYSPKVQEGYRTFERQQMLYNQGRTTPGNRVTGASAGRSFHNYGLAIDVVMQGSNPYRSNSPFWDALGRAAARHGLVWGGNWNNPDRPHLELHPGLTASQAGTLLDEHRQGGLQAVWASLGLATGSGVGGATTGPPIPNGGRSTFNPNETLYLSDLTEYLQQHSQAYRARMAQLASDVIGAPGGIDMGRIGLLEAARMVRTGEATLAPGTIANIDIDTWVYVVNGGDFLSSIASAFGMTAAQLAQANGIDPDRIAVGQLIIITDPPKLPTRQGTADYATLGIAEFTDSRQTGTTIENGYEPLRFVGQGVPADIGDGQIDTSGIPRLADIFGGTGPLRTDIERLDLLQSQIDEQTAAFGNVPGALLRIEELRADRLAIVRRVTSSQVQERLLIALLQSGWGAETAVAVAVVWGSLNPNLTPVRLLAAFREPAIAETFGRALYSGADARTAALMAYRVLARGDFGSEIIAPHLRAAVASGQISEQTALIFTDLDLAQPDQIARELELGTGLLTGADVNRSLRLIAIAIGYEGSLSDVEGLRAALLGGRGQIQSAVDGSGGRDVLATAIPELNQVQQERLTALIRSIGPDGWGAFVSRADRGMRVDPATSYVEYAATMLALGSLNGVATLAGQVIPGWTSAVGGSGVAAGALGFPAEVSAVSKGGRLFWSGAGKTGSALGGLGLLLSGVAIGGEIEAGEFGNSAQDVTEGAAFVLGAAALVATGPVGLIFGGLAITAGVLSLVLDDRQPPTFDDSVYEVLQWQQRLDLSNQRISAPAADEVDSQLALDSLLATRQRLLETRADDAWESSSQTAYANMADPNNPRDPQTVVTTIFRVRDTVSGEYYYLTKKSQSGFEDDISWGIVRPVNGFLPPPDTRLQDQIAEARGDLREASKRAAEDLADAEAALMSLSNTRARLLEHRSADIHESHTDVGFGNLADPANPGDAVSITTTIYAVQDPYSGVTYFRTVVSQHDLEPIATWGFVRRGYQPTGDQIDEAVAQAERTVSAAANALHQTEVTYGDRGASGQP